MFSEFSSTAKMVFDPKLSEPLFCWDVSFFRIVLIKLWINYQWIPYSLNLVVYVDGVPAIFKNFATCGWGIWINVRNKEPSSAVVWIIKYCTAWWVMVPLWSVEKVAFFSEYMQHHAMAHVLMSRAWARFWLHSSPWRVNFGQCTTSPAIFSNCGKNSSHFVIWLR